MTIGIIENTSIFFLIIVACALVVTAIAIAAFALSISNRNKLRRIMQNCSLGNLDETIVTYYDNVAKLSGGLHSAISRFDAVESNMLLSTQKVAAVKYSAFGVGAQLSYSIAILDGRDDGVVMTCIFGRNECNTYLKPISGGKGEKLSEEEEQAIRQAIDGHAERFMK